MTIDSSCVEEVEGGGAGETFQRSPIPNEFMCSAQETSCDPSFHTGLRILLDQSQELKGTAKVGKSVYSSLKEPRPCLHVHLGA